MLWRTPGLNILMQVTRIKQAIYAVAALCLPAAQAMHPKPVRIAPVPAARTRYVPGRHSPVQPKHQPKPTRKNTSRVLAMASHGLHKQKHDARPHIAKAAEKHPLHIPRAVRLTSETHPAAALTPVVSVIRQNSEHPQLPPTDELATKVQMLPGLYGSDGRLIMPPALRGSHDILVHQNLMADQDGLNRVQDDEDLLQLRASRALVPLPVNEGLRIDDRLPTNRRFCRPWVAQFLINLGRAHYDQFHTSLQINSAVRTVAFQVRLLRTNGNAAQANGEAASPHLTGQAVDLAKRGLPEAELAWIRMYLKALVDRNAIDVEEEFQQACFHLSVYRSYAPPAAPAQPIASTHRPLAPGIAAAIE